MADKFYAVTKIQHGTRTEDGSQEGKYSRVVFNEGDEVKGLSKEDMQSLWNAGALRRVTSEEASEEKQDEEQKPAPAKTAQATKSVK